MGGSIPAHLLRELPHSHSPPPFPPTPHPPLCADYEDLKEKKFFPGLVA
jgi:hypothetical protein